MEEMKQAVVSICLLSTGVSACLLICPDTSLQKQVKFLISLLCIVSLILPFRNLQIPDSLEAIQQTHADTSMQEVTEASVEKALEAVLQQNGISCTEIKASVHIDDSQCISISDVEVTCDDFQNAVRILKELLGEEVQFHVTEILE